MLLLLFLLAVLPQTREAISALLADLQRSLH